MQTFLNFIWEFRYVIILILGTILFYTGNKKQFEAEVLKAILVAKNFAKQGVLKTGLEQENWVVSNLYSFLSIKFSFIKMFKEETIRKIISKIYKSAFDLIDDGSLNGSIK